MMITRDALILPMPQRARFGFDLEDYDEVRSEDGRSTTVRLRGIASVYRNDYDVYGGPAQGGWVERIAPGAFDQTLAEGPDVVFLANHDGLPMARTKSGTLELAAEKRGLGMTASLDPRDTEASNLLVKIQRGDVSEMSFGFRVTSQEWAAHPKYKDDNQSLRTITGVNLNRGDVSAVTYGANPATSIDIATQLRAASVVDLELYRALIEERLTPAVPTGGMPVAESTGGMPAHLVAQLLNIPI